MQQLNAEMERLGLQSGGEALWRAGRPVRRVAAAPWSWAWRMHYKSYCAPDADGHSLLLATDGELDIAVARHSGAPYHPILSYRGLQPSSGVGPRQAQPKATRKCAQHRRPDQ